MKHRGSKIGLRSTLILTGCLVLLLSLASPELFIAASRAQVNKSQGKAMVAPPQGVQTVNSPTAARLESFAAATYNGGTLIQWQTGFEVDNLGFNLYRDASGKRTLLTPQVLAGSALVTGQGTPLTAGKSYAWWDGAATGKLIPKAGTTYWLEELSVDGQSTWHGPISAQATGGPPPPIAAPAKLISLGLTDKPSHPLQAVASLPRPVAESQALTAINPQAGQFAVKLRVDHEGWYRVTQPQLLAVGLPPTADPRNFQLYVDGQPQACRVNGQSDGSFDKLDTFEFYAIGINSPYSNTRVYWLAVGASPGVRINSTANPASPVAGGNFPFTLERKDRTIYYSGLLNGETENIFGPLVTSGSVTQAFTVPHLDPTATGASLQVSLQGFNQVSHQVNVKVNGTLVGSLSFFGNSTGQTTLSVPPGLLLEGANQVVLQAAAGGDISFIDYVRLTYNHVYTVDSDQLKLTAQANQALTLNGFSNNNIHVFDITDPAVIQEITGTVQSQGATFSVSLMPLGAGQRTLLAVTSAQAQAPKQVLANVPSSWNKSSQGADLIILTVSDLFSAVDDLRVARQSQGLSVAVVDVEDVYDEFSFGQKTPQAIKDFLALAKVIWKKGAKYCVIVGDATYDPKNYLGMGDWDMVPTKLIDTFFMECASDVWLADFDGDGIEDMSLGRLPVRTGEETERVIAKILSYDNQGLADEVVLATDQNDGYDFEGASMELHNVLPGDLRGLDIRRGQLGTAAAKAVLLDDISRGQRVINYVGHGNIDQWSGNFLTAGDAAAMTNSDYLPVFLLMTCLNGYFIDPAFESLGEALVKNPRGGAAAVWTSTGQTVPEGQWAINQEMYMQMYTQPQVRVGDAARIAKLVTGDVDVRRSWILLGDPSMRVH